MIRIEVTKEDIMRGMKKDCFSCPIARAMRRQGFTSVTIGRNQILASHADGSVVDVAAPKKVRVFVSRFDDGQYVEPFSFVLETKQESQEAAIVKAQRDRRDRSMSAHYAPTEGSDA